MKDIKNMSYDELRKYYAEKIIKEHNGDIKKAAKAINVCKRDLYAALRGYSE